MLRLPPLRDVQTASPIPGQSSPLSKALEILFERSPILEKTLQVQLNEILKLTTITTYSDFIDLALGEVAKWNIEVQAEFISGHPRIGETKNISFLSAKEQSRVTTPANVLVRLAHLNDVYERKYPGLRYITFVNGRSRADIVGEMENMLKISQSVTQNNPPLDTTIPVEIGSTDWREELNRAIYDIGRIAKNRLELLGATHDS